MAYKYAIKPLRVNNELWRLEPLKVFYSGWYLPNPGTAKYFLYTEHWHESANTIVTALHHMLLPYINQNLKVFIAFDRHSTQLNNTLLCYGEWIVRYCKWFQWVEIDYGETGHTKYVMLEYNTYYIFI